MAQPSPTPTSDFTLAGSSTTYSISASSPRDNDELEKPNKGAPAPKPKPRKTRTRTGCLTCRIRRVKCDELKPNCVRCTSTGRKCDGYPAIHATKPPTEQVRDPPKDFISNCISSPRSPLEKRGLFHFRIRTAGDLNAYFDSDFWNSFVLQASDSEPAIRHALLALSALHRSLEVSGDVPLDQYDKNHRLALQEYNKAVASTVQRIAKSDILESEVTLTVCIIFICLELMQNNYNAAIGHLKCGLRILATIIGQSGSTGSCSQISGYSTLRYNLDHMFRKIITQTIFLEAPYYKGHVMAPNIEHTLHPFSSITQARESLEDIYTLIYEYSRSVRYNPSEIPCQGPETHVKFLRKWHVYFLSLITLRRAHFNPKEYTGATILQLHYLALFIISATALDTSTKAFEAFTPTFSRIVALSEHLLKRRSSSDEGTSPAATSALPKFSFDMGVIPPLYYTALRCRSSDLRWRAIALLRQAPLREGIWGAAMTANMAQKFVKVEEDNAIKVRAAAMIGGHNCDDIPSVRVFTDANEDESGRNVYLTVRLSKPSAHERLIRMHIGKKGLKTGGREEIVTW